MRISDWSSDVCSSDLPPFVGRLRSIRCPPKESQPRGYRPALILWPFRRGSPRRASFGGYRHFPGSSRSADTRGRRRRTPPDRAHSGAAGTRASFLSLLVFADAESDGRRLDRFDGRALSVARCRSAGGRVAEAGFAGDEIGRASCRETVCQYVWTSAVAVTL